MANHSLISLKKAITPEDVERHAKEIVARRFKGKILIHSPEDLTEAWQAERAWLFEVPGTRPKDPGPFHPDENLAFAFWLNKGGQTIEIRHVVLQPWVSWAQSLFAHELAQSFEVKRFDGGDGLVKTNPSKYKDSARAYYTGSEPVGPDELGYLEQHYFRHIPEGWE